MKNRLKASELLGRSEADFTDNHNHKLPEGCGVLVTPSQIGKDEWSKMAQEQQKQREPVNRG